MRRSVAQAGNVLFLILIAVMLFAGLTYAVTHSTRSAPGTIENEQQKLDQAVLNNCEVSINLALMRLTNIGGCDMSEINYELPDGTNANSSAPIDGHCNVFHPSYGGAVPCGTYLDPSCDLTALNIGEDCDGVVYAGESGGNRIYTSTADHSVGTRWANAATNTGSTSSTDGLANTNLLVGLIDGGEPYEAAQLCRAQGAEWYLPSQDELGLLYTNRAAIGGFNESGSFPSGWYWESSESDTNTVQAQRFSDGGQTVFSKFSPLPVRCVRRD